MPFQFYKASPSNKGNACGFSVNSKDQAVYVSFIKQTSWDATKKTGSFKGGDQCNIKFGIHEIGGLILAIEQTLHPAVAAGKMEVAPFSGYHDGGTQTTSIKFGPYFVTTGDDGKFLKGITLSVTKKAEGSDTKQTFTIGFTLAEAVTVKRYLEFALDRIFTGIHSADKQEREARMKAKENNE